MTKYNKNQEFTDKLFPALVSVSCVFCHFPTPLGRIAVNQGIKKAYQEVSLSLNFKRGINTAKMLHMFVFLFKIAN